MLPVVILAGGLATRLRPVTQDVPKALLLVNGQPFVYHQLQLLFRRGIREVVFCVGYLGQQIEQYVGNGEAFGLRVRYSYDGEYLLGTGGAIKQALPLLSDTFFVLYGDSYLPCDYAAVLSSFHQQNKPGLMTVFRNDGQWDKSNVVFEQGKILAYDKKQPTEAMHYIDYGLGILQQSVFDEVPAHQPYDLAELYQRLLKNKQLAAVAVSQRFYETGSFAGIKELEYYLSGAVSAPLSS